MKLQKQISRKIGKKKYAKYVVAIPSAKIKKLGWKPGDELKMKTKGKRAVIEPA